jgi:2-oxoglutarate dehydrogenase E1 component
VSKLEDMLEGTYFQRVIVENGKGDNMKSYELVSPEQMRKIIFCSGKIFYPLYSSRQSRGIKDITIVRVEQLAPFPFDILQSVIKKYSNDELVWVQEEPKNMG